MKRDKLNFHRDGVSVSLSGELTAEEQKLASDVIEDLLRGIVTFRKFRKENGGSE